jgi:hypothetical protein
MATKHYINRPVGRAELESLRTLAIAEEASFFDRNQHLGEACRDRLIAVALCQGAALQYLGRGYAVNDFDVHFFYSQNPAKLRLSRAVKSIWATVGSFQKVRVDFVRTVVPSRVLAPAQERSAELLHTFLRNPPTDNAMFLQKKAVIGLLPEHLFATVIWEPAL